MTADEVRKELRVLGSPQKAIAVARFFKSGVGEYGEGEVFLGITLPEQRKVAKQFLGLPMAEVEDLLQSREHEFRMTALIIWVQQFEKSNEATQRGIYQFYLANMRWINNWDLVDVSAAAVVGGWIDGRDHGVLERLAVSESLWERRIAIIATHYFVTRGESADALQIADVLKHDSHDLIQKAVGWTLREVGKRCGQDVEAGWLAHRYQIIPRTMLRYAIEHFEPERRQAYLQGLI